MVSADALRTLRETTADPAAPFPDLSGQRSLRVVFLGDQEQLARCSLTTQAAGLAPTALALTERGDLTRASDALREQRPDVVICLRPDLLAPGELGGVDALSIAFVTARPGGPAGAWGDFDRIVCTEPDVADRIAALTTVWRSLPLPVADEHYAPVRAVRRPVGVAFAAAGRARCAPFLAAAEGEPDVRVAPLLDGDGPSRLGEEIDVVVNLHDRDDRAGFEHDCALALAGGRLLVTERLEPGRGVEPSIDYVELAAPDQLKDLLRRLRGMPDAYRRVRISGRRKAERFRASSVYPRLVRDLLVDVRALGGDRTARARHADTTKGELTR